MSRLVVKMKRQLYFPLLITLLVSSVFGVLPWSQPSTVYAAPDTLQLLPDGVGDYTNIESVTGAATHWEAVDDPVVSPDDITTYLSTTNTTQEKDAFTLQDTSQTGTITSVKVYFRVASSAANKIHFMQPFLRLGTDETPGTEINHSVKTWTTYNQILARPGGGSWTWTDINNLQVAVGLRNADVGNPQLTQVYVEVDYTLPSITNTPDNYPFGTLSEGGTYETTGGLTTAYFTVTNNSAFDVNITISGTDMTGGTTWTLSNDGSAGNMIYGLNAGLEGGDYTIVVPEDTANTLVSGLAGGGGTQRWGLQFLAPTTMSDGASKSGTVTLTAAAA